MNVELKTYKIEEINFINNLKPNVKIELGNKFSYNVSYMNNNLCKGEFVAEISDKQNPKAFSIKVKMTGIFSHKADMKKEEIHINSYRAIVPFVRSAIATITTASGMPPVLMPFVDIDNQNIYKVELNKPQNPQSEV